jgi:hypothetical protein
MVKKSSPTVALECSLLCFTMVALGRRSRNCRDGVSGKLNLTRSFSGCAVENRKYFPRGDKFEVYSTRACKSFRTKSLHVRSGRMAFQIYPMELIGFRGKKWVNFRAKYVCTLVFTLEWNCSDNASLRTKWSLLFSLVYGCNLIEKLDQSNNTKSSVDPSTLRAPAHCRLINRPIFGRVGLLESILGQLNSRIGGAVGRPFANELAGKRFLKRKVA